MPTRQKKATKVFDAPSQHRCNTTLIQATRPYRAHASNKAAPTAPRDRLIFGVTHLLSSTVVLHFIFLNIFLSFSFLRGIRFCIEPEFSLKVSSHTRHHCRYPSLESSLLGAVAASSVRVAWSAVLNDRMRTRCTRPNMISRTTTGKTLKMIVK